MNAYDFVHLSLHALGGEVKGKTKLQKVIFFLGVLTETIDDLGFRPHFYGPYSSDVAGAVDRLKALGFVDQNVASGGAFDQSGFEVARHDYRLTEAGTDVARKKTLKYGARWDKIREAAEKLKTLGERDYVKMSIAAKTYFLLPDKHAHSAEQLAAMAPHFGWSVSKEQVKEAVHYLKALGLVRTE